MIKMEYQQVNGNLTKYEKAMLTKFGEKMDIAMTMAENHAKDTAPWTDRTANARNSIFGRVQQAGVGDTQRWKGYLGIGMEYGAFLELSNGGKYHVIWPTIQWLRGELGRILANG